MQIRNKIAYEWKNSLHGVLRELKIRDEIGGLSSIFLYATWPDNATDCQRRVAVRKSYSDIREVRDACTAR